MTKQKVVIDSDEWDFIIAEITDLEQWGHDNGHGRGYTIADRLEALLERIKDE